MNTLHAAVVTFNLAELEPEYGDIQRITSRLELERMSVVCVVAQELHSLSLRDMKLLLACHCLPWVVAMGSVWQLWQGAFS